MTTETKKYTVVFPRTGEGKTAPKRTFFDLARKHIVKGKRGGPRDLSRRVDEIAYDI